MLLLLLWKASLHVKVLNFLSKNKDFENKGRYFALLHYERGNVELLNKLFWSRFTIFPGLRCFRLEAAFKNTSQLSGMF